MKIGERGQITIPKSIREKYGFLPQIEVDFVPQKKGVLIRKKQNTSALLTKYTVFYKKTSERILILSR